MSWRSLVLGISAQVGLAGCGSPHVPPSLRIDASNYNVAFDAAVEATRAHGMPAILRDRRAGVIETEARVAGSLLEPWRTDNASLEQTAENTLAFQRRKARFEFTPLEAQTPVEIDGQASAGADGVDSQTPVPDMTQMQGQMEVRVSVYLERAHTPGLRRSTWTRSKTTTTDLIEPEGEQGQSQGTFWVPVTRDPTYERRLLAAIDKALNASLSSSGQQRP